MVMSKVSKTVIASFLCLLFNAGGNVTNAMNAMNDISTTNNNNNSLKENNEFDINISNNIISNKNRFELKTNKIITEDDKKDDKKDEEKDDDGKKTPDGEKSVWRWLLPVMTGVGGTAIGILVGKFVL